MTEGILALATTLRMRFTVDITTLATFSDVCCTVWLVTGLTDGDTVITDRVRAKCAARHIFFGNVALAVRALNHVSLAAGITVDNTIESILGAQRSTTRDTVFPVFATDRF